MRNLVALSLALIVSTPVLASAEASLRGSPASMREQNRVAHDLGLSFFRTGDQVLAAAEESRLVRMMGNGDYEVASGVSYPYLHPATALFVERLGRQYREACGEPLVMTSGVRPTTRQPRNSHDLSVHPAGIAVDLRVSQRRACRAWLEDALLGMEGAGLLNAVRERRPPHYHVAVYPEQYLAYAEQRMAEELAERRAEEAAAAVARASVASTFLGVDQGQTGEEQDSLPLALAVVLVGAGVGGRLLLRRRAG